MFLCHVFLQESEILEHLKDPQLSESEASVPKSFLGLVSCSEPQWGGVREPGVSLPPEK